MSVQNIPPSGHVQTLSSVLSSVDVEPLADVRVEAFRRPAIERRRHLRSHVSPRPIGRVYAIRVALTTAPLLVADVLAVSVSALMALLLTPATISAGAVGDPLRLLLALTAGVLAVNLALGLYPGTGVSPVPELRLTTISVAVLTAAFMLGSLVRGSAGHLQLTLVSFGVWCALALPLSRSLVRSVVSKTRWWREPILVLGDCEAAEQTAAYFASKPTLGLRPVAVSVEGGRITSNYPEDPAEFSDDLASLRLFAERHNVFWAAIPLPENPSPKLNHLAIGCANLFPHLLLIRGTLDLPSLWTGATECGGMLGIQIGKSLLLPGPRSVKRILDATLGVLLSIASVPLIALIAVAIKLTSSGPVFYTQTRIGKGRQPFRMWKFRTMVVDADRVLHRHLEADPRLREEWDRDQKLRMDPRVTKIGSLLRRTSLDELPQLWNVLRGDMSLVGPRPVPEPEIPRYGDRFGLYLNVMPGMTGLWQVSGRNGLAFEERVRLCSYYVQNWSPWLDLHILARTAKVVVRGNGAY